MKPITFTKSFIFDQDIVKVTDLLVEDDFSYDIRKGDLLIRGQISGSGSAKSELDVFPFTFSIDVDCLLALTLIDCLSDLRLQFKEYRTAIDGKLVTLTLKYELFGNGEPYKEVVTKESPEFEENLLRALGGTDAPGAAPLLDSSLRAAIADIIDGDVEVISTLETLEPLDSTVAPDLDDEVEIKIEAPELEGVKREEKPAPETEEPSAPSEPKMTVAPAEKDKDLKSESTVEPSKPEIKPESKSQDEPKFEQKQVSECVIETKEELFAEKYEIAYLFYKVKAGDDYQTIARLFKADPELLRSENRGKDLQDGTLVKIPRRG